MAQNELLRELHYEQLRRKGLPLPKPSTSEKAVGPDSEFCCAVCYTDGETSGLVTPKCAHKICLACYTTIVIGHKEKAKCPECRTVYMPEDKSKNITLELRTENSNAYNYIPSNDDDDDDNMPPLIGLNDDIVNNNIEYIYYNMNSNNTNNNHDLINTTSQRLINHNINNQTVELIQSILHNALNI
jgi:hypothetical protein